MRRVGGNGYWCVPSGTITDLPIEPDAKAPNASDTRSDG